MTFNDPKYSHIFSVLSSLH